MACFPFFVELKGRKCVVVGGGKVASGKIDMLVQFGAQMSIIAPEVSSSIEELGRQGKICIFKKEYSEQDIEGAFLVIAATSYPEVNERVFRDSEKNNILVNVADDPEKCTFIFPSVVKRGNLVIGISTSGTYPALSKRIRKIIEEVFSDEYSQILNLLADFRVKVRKGVVNHRLREKVLTKVIDDLYNQDTISYAALSSIIDRYEAELFDRR